MSLHVASGDGAPTARTAPSVETMETQKDLLEFFSGLKSTTAHQHVAHNDHSDLGLPHFSSDDDSALSGHSEHGRSGFNESEMKRKLLDIEGSFIPEPSSEASVLETNGSDDTYLFGGSPGHSRTSLPGTSEIENAGDGGIGGNNRQTRLGDSLNSILSPPTPYEAYQTPATMRYDETFEEEDEDTPRTNHTHSGVALDDDNLTSSPAAAAAKRAISRAGGGEGFKEHGLSKIDAGLDSFLMGGENLTESNLSMSRLRRSSSHSTLRPPLEEIRDLNPQVNPNSTAAMSPFVYAPILSSSQRPNFPQSRHESQVSSTSLLTFRSDSSTDAASETPYGADYALQTGGAVPSSSASRPNHDLSRLPSFGSVASSISGFSDGRILSRTSSSISGRGTLRAGLDSARLNEAERDQHDSESETPRPSTAATTVTDTVIAQHVRNIQVPETIAREYRQRHRSTSPDKPQPFPTPSGGRSKNTLTLKEQNSRIDKLGKENFDLKLKIHYLDQALQTRSEEGVKDMISRNVQLQTDLVNLKKDNSSLRRRVQDLERQLREQEDGLMTARQQVSNSEDERMVMSPIMMEMEDEIISLNEKLANLSSQNEKLKSEAMTKDIKSQKTAEFAKLLGGRTNLDAYTGIEETMEMWKDLLQTETARREQADEDAQKLREEISRLKNETFLSTRSNSNVRALSRVSSRNHMGYSRSHSQSGNSDQRSDKRGTTTEASSTLVDQLKHENAELRRDLGAQTSMLTSRNREKERLQAEIENLKLTRNGADGVRSGGSDSIFDRSASRQYQRSRSRTSGRTRISQLSDAEREEYERRQAALRDDLAAFKMENQVLERELNGHVDQLEALEEKLRASTETLRALQAERDEVILDFENLKEEAQEGFAELEDQLEKSQLQVEALEKELAAHIENSSALQHEIRIVTESVLRLEDSQASQSKRVESLERELEDANSEIETLDKQMRETSKKKQRLEVQEESNRDEIKFLREEQEGDKIRIGDLESSLRVAESRLQDEKDRLKELEQRLTEQRRQREMLDTHGKQETQHILDELNAQIARSKEEVRRLRGNLQNKEMEASAHKTNLQDLETGLRQALGKSDGPRSGLIADVLKAQRELDWTVQELDKTKGDLAEKERVLRAREALLESTGLEGRKLSDLLEKERQGRKQDAQAFEAEKRKSQDTGRVTHQHEARIQELEMERNRDRKKRQTLERVYEDQLVERNNLLLALWSRLSALCGADWVKKHAYVNGEMPSVGVIARDYAAFCKNLVLALNIVEKGVGSFESKVAGVEDELRKEYQGLKHVLNQRMKRLDQLEQMVEKQSIVRIPSRASSNNAQNQDTVESSRDHSSSEIGRLRVEVNVLKAELQSVHGAMERSGSQHGLSSDILEKEGDDKAASNAEKSQTIPAPALFRHHSTTGAQTAPRTSAAVGRNGLPQGGGGQLHPPPLVHSHTAPQGRPLTSSSTMQNLSSHSSSALFPSSQPNIQQRPQSKSSEGQPVSPGQVEKVEKTWMHRFREMERRLRVEREGRLLDRSGARKRLEHGKAQNEELRRELGREKTKKEILNDEDGSG